MKRLSIIFLALCLLLCSCRRLEEPPEETDPVVEENTADNKAHTDTAPEDTAPKDTITDTASPLPCLIGFYDDLENNGNYTRLSSWNEPWVSGKDIAVFDIIPSSDASLYSSSYKELWNTEAAKLEGTSDIKPYLVIEYTLIDGSTNTVTVLSWADAEEINRDGYIEIYLYDDIHQPDGAWYSHLTESTTDENTVITSVKLTAGKMIDAVGSIKFEVCIDNSSPAIIDIINGNEESR